MSKPTYRVRAHQVPDQGSRWVLRVIDASDDADPLPVGHNCSVWASVTSTVSSEERRRILESDARELVGLWVRATDAEEDAFEVTVEFADPERLPVYMRVGDDGIEQLIGTVAIPANRGLVATALAELLRAAAFYVEETDSHREGEADAE